MKTIQINDEDYETLMELSRELQTQPNHSQAYPYFWEPASEKLETDVNNEGEVKQILADSEMYSPEEYADYQSDIYADFLIEIDREEQQYNEDLYDDDLEQEWLDYLECSTLDVSIYSSNWEQKTDHNPSLFLSDVQGYIKSNKHHLGRNPHTYARSCFRMPKMEKLVQLICRLNPQLEKDINHEARRFVLKRNNPGKFNGGT